MQADYNHAKDRATMLTINLTSSDLPVNPLKLIKNKYKTDLIYTDLCGEDGYCFYRRKTNAYKIYIDNSLYHKRCNFTVAHEVGHIVLGHMFLPNHIREKYYDVLDKEASAFASELLMPTHLMNKYIKLSTSNLCNLFDVSHEAMSIRLNIITNIRSYAL